MPNSVSSPRGDTLLATTVGDLGSELTAHTGDDWTGPAGALEWSIEETLDHLVDMFVWYAVQLASGARNYTPVDAVPAAGTRPEDRIAVVEACASLLLTVVRTAPAERRVWHRFGSASADDLAVMAMTEVLVHGHDISQGLGRPWRPEDIAVRTSLTRLFPQVCEDDDDPWDVLLWAHGRVPLPGRADQMSWVWELSASEP